MEQKKVKVDEEEEGNVPKNKGNSCRLMGQFNSQ
jgi:hypothetical protein